jgi:hypothetical protein
MSSKKAQIIFKNGDCYEGQVINGLMDTSFIDQSSTIIYAHK